MDRTQLLIGVAVALFSLGLVGVIVRRNVLVMLMCMELMLNGTLATRFSGNRVGKPFVTAVGCGLPILAFGLVVKALLDLRAGG